MSDNPKTAKSKKTRKIRVVSEMLTIRQAAEALSVCQETVRRQIRCGRVPAIKIGVVYRVRLADVEKALAVSQAT